MLVWYRTDDSDNKRDADLCDADVDHYCVNSLCFRTAYDRTYIRTSPVCRMRKMRDEASHDTPAPRW
jgi:hypothetical protein